MNAATFVRSWPSVSAWGAGLITAALGAGALGFVATWAPLREPSTREAIDALAGALERMELGGDALPLVARAAIEMNARDRLAARLGIVEPYDTPSTIRLGDALANTGANADGYDNN